MKKDKLQEEGKTDKINVAEIASSIPVWLKVPISSYIREVDRKNMQISSLTSDTGDFEQRKHAMREFRKSLSRVIAIKKMKVVYWLKDGGIKNQ